MRHGQFGCHPHQDVWLSSYLLFHFGWLYIPHDERGVLGTSDQRVTICSQRQASHHIPIYVYI
jgi:hypothetical protein